MSLWDGIKMVGGAAIEAAQKRQEKILQYKEYYCYHDDESLKRGLKSSCLEKRIACKMLLEERGYKFKSE